MDSTQSRRGSSGFTLVEMLVVILIIGILATLALPNFTKVRNKAKESQVKNNLHNLQLTLERYGTDNESYPAWIYGGDRTDSFVLTQGEWTRRTTLDPNLVQPTWVEVASEGDGDPLIIYGYLTAYPPNPFIQRAPSVDTDAQSTRIIRQTQVTGAPLVTTRDVGGMENNLMFEVSGGPPRNSVVGNGNFPRLTNHPGWEFIYPIYSHNPNTNQVINIGDFTGDPALPGNFYYYSINEGASDNSWGRALFEIDPMSASPAMVPPTTSGYRLVGYGALKTIGEDLYDAYGDFDDHMRTAHGNDPVQPRNPGNGGPDGVRDGAIIVLNNS